MPKNFEAALPRRCRNALLSLYDDDPAIFNKPQVIVDRGPEQFKFERNFGPVSLRLLAETLYDFGYLEDPEGWLQGGGPGL